MINEYVSREIENIKNLDKYFSASEFDDVKLTEEKKNIFQKAVNWIRTRNNGQFKNNNDNEEKSINPNDKEER